MTKTKYNFKKAKRQLTNWQKVFLQSVKKKKNLKFIKVLIFHSAIQIELINSHNVFKVGGQYYM